MSRLRIPYRAAPECRTAAMPSWLPVFASPQVTPRALTISDHGWTVLVEGVLVQMPAGVYVYETETA